MVICAFVTRTARNLSSIVRGRKYGACGRSRWTLEATASSPARARPGISAATSRDHLPSCQVPLATGGQGCRSFPRPGRCREINHGSGLRGARPCGARGRHRRAYTCGRGKLSSLSTGIPPVGGCGPRRWAFWERAAGTSQACRSGAGVATISTSLKMVIDSSLGRCRWLPSTFWTSARAMTWHPSLNPCLQPSVS